MKGEGRGEGQIDPPAPEKTTLKKPSLISVKSSTFHEQLKWTDVKPVFKKNSRTD